VSLLYFYIHKPRPEPVASLPLPAYNSSDEVEKAWARLVQASANVCTRFCNNCNKNETFVLQLLHLFPYPLLRSTGSLAGNKSLSTLMSRPMNYSMRLYGGQLYRGITLTYKTQVDPMVHEACGADYQVNRPLQIILCPIYQSTQGRWLIQPGQKYVLIDITSKRKSLNHELHILLVCTEITLWKQPCDEWNLEPIKSIEESEAYHYRLRRVSSMEVNMRDYHSYPWLPFRADLESQIVSVELEPGKPNRSFWDPAITVTIE